jgi:hypothetical protein
MRRALLLTLFPLATVCAISACGEDKRDDDDDGASDGDGTGATDPDTDADAPQPDVQVSPASIDFGELYVWDGTLTETLTITNTGEADLLIQDTVLEDGEDSFALGSISSVALAPGEEATLTVTFDASAPASVTDRVRISTNDPDQPTVDIPLTATGTAPRIGIGPSELYFGAVEIGCEETQPIQIANAGNDDLEIIEVHLSGFSTELVFDPRTETNGALPWTIPPGSLVEVAVSYAPSDELDDTNQLYVESDDYNAPQLFVPVDGQGVLSGSNTDTFAHSGTSPSDTFVLTETPVVETIQVQIDGVTHDVGWDYEPAINAVVLWSDHVPRGDATIEISYALSSCAR